MVKTGDIDGVDEPDDDDDDSSVDCVEDADEDGDDVDAIDDVNITSKKDDDLNASGVGAALNVDVVAVEFENTVDDAAPIEVEVVDIDVDIDVGGSDVVEGNDDSDSGVDINDWVDDDVSVVIREDDVKVVIDVSDEVPTR